MSKDKQVDPRVVAVQNRRRSGGHGPHGKPYNRSADKRAHINRNREED